MSKPIFITAIDNYRDGEKTKELYLVLNSWGKLCGVPVGRAGSVCTVSPVYLDDNNRWRLSRCTTDFLDGEQSAQLANEGSVTYKVYMDNESRVIQQFSLDF